MTSMFRVSVSKQQSKDKNRIVKPENRKEVIKQQKAWLNNAVKNRDYSYAEVPDWMVREIKNGVYR